MTKEEVFEEVRKIAINYGIFQCMECAEAIKEWLKDNGIAGVHLEIRAVGRIKFIVSRRWRDEQDSIAQTGIHQGVETLGRVFDNLPEATMNREEWIADFTCVSGDFEVVELELF